MNVISVCVPGCSYSLSTASFPSSPRRYFASAAKLATVAFIHPSLLRQGRSSINVSGISSSSNLRAEKESTVVSAGLGDFWGGDLLGFDLDQWCKDVEDYGSIAVYAPHEGGYEGRYAARLKTAGYHFMNISARGLGDPEAYLTKIHGVRPFFLCGDSLTVDTVTLWGSVDNGAHLGKQAIECFYMPPELDYRLSALPKDFKGIVLWVIEAKVLSKTELQYLALLPALRPKVKVIAECGTWRSYRWKPLREVCGLPLTQTSDATEEPNATAQTSDPIEEPKSTETTETAKATVSKSQIEENSPVRVSL